MRSLKKLELSKETLRCLTSDLPSDQLGGVRGGEDASLNTCLDCWTTIVKPTLVGNDCWGTLAR